MSIFVFFYSKIELNSNINNIQISTDKVGNYTISGDGGKQYFLLFKIPVLLVRRPNILIVGNIGGTPFASMYTVQELTDTLQDPRELSLGGDHAGLTVQMNANLGDMTQLRIAVTTPAGMGVHLNILVPGGRLIGVQGG